MPVFNRLAAAALLTGSVLTLVLLNYFEKPEKHLFTACLRRFGAVSVTHSDESARFLDGNRAQFTHRDVCLAQRGCASFSRVSN